MPRGTGPDARNRTSDPDSRVLPGAGEDHHRVITVESPCRAPPHQEQPGQAIRPSGQPTEGCANGGEGRRGSLLTCWPAAARPARGELGYCGAAGGAAHQRAVHLEQSLQRELVCGSGAAACAAQTTSSASRPVQSGPSPSPASARGRAVDSGRGCPAGRAGGVKRLTASSPTSHPPHPTSRRSRASSDLIRGKAA